MGMVQGGPESSYLGTCDSSPGWNIHGFKACREEVFREADAGPTAEEVEGAGRTLALRERGDPSCLCPKLGTESHPCRRYCLSFPCTLSALQPLSTKRWAPGGSGDEAASYIRRGGVTPAVRPELAGGWGLPSFSVGWKMGSVSNALLPPPNEDTPMHTAGSVPPWDCG